MGPYHNPWLSLQGFLAPGEIDPLNRRFSTIPKPVVVVQGEREQGIPRVALQQDFPTQERRMWKAGTLEGPWVVWSVLAWARPPRLAWGSQPALLPTARTPWGDRAPPSPAGQP